MLEGTVFEAVLTHWFRSRSVRRVPCGTQGFGIMTEYLRSGVRREQRRDRGRQGRGSRSGDARFGATDAGDERTDARESVYRTPAHKDASSRQNGWELLPERLNNVRKPEGPRL